RVQPNATVIAGATAPYGDPPGVDRMMPVIFMREFLCLHGAALSPRGCPHPAHFDAIDHHPYAATPINPALTAGNVSVPDLGKIVRIVAAAVRSGRALPAGPKPIWVTEIAWTSNPPGPGTISLQLQSRYVALAAYTLWRQGVGHMFWLVLRDPGPASRGFAGSGLFFASGRRKPSTAAFGFPFVATAARPTRTLWGIAPRAGVVSIERRYGRSWRPVAALTTSAGRVFYGRLRCKSGVQLRAKVGRLISPSWLTA
ncbi:MAG: hypothetical protein M3016_09860, partial [Actinomycetota bacterium]|nr:hypothetical protein [Actinomycetota bacterium]